MEYLYNAFISYRHADLDSRVAGEIQKKLERYHVPERILKKNHGKKITRVFRDQEELQATSDLTEDIAQALAQSEFLIVICSPSTKESDWVEREIEIFLQNHSRDKIVTVLAAGEPQDVIPKILTSVTKRSMSQNGKEILQEEEKHLLSCDYRKGSKKEKKEEFLRLVSKLLDVKYNDLKQRNREYFLMRMTIISAVIACAAFAFAIYAVHQSNRIQKQSEQIQTQSEQIQEEFRENLKAQSRYLTKEAEELLADNDTVRAVKKLVEALPGLDALIHPDTEQGIAANRPILPETVLTLSGALGAYDTPSNVLNTMKSTGIIEVGGNHDLPFFLSEDGKYIFTSDGDTISVWDSVTLKKIQEFGTTEDDSYNQVWGFENLIIKKDKPEVIYASPDAFMCRNYLTGELIWYRDFRENPAPEDISMETDEEDNIFYLDALLSDAESDEYEDLGEDFYEDTDEDWEVIEEFFDEFEEEDDYFEYTIYAEMLKDEKRILLLTDSRAEWVDADTGETLDCVYLQVGDGYRVTNLVDVSENEEKIVFASDRFQSSLGDGGQRIYYLEKGKGNHCLIEMERLEHSVDQVRFWGDNLVFLTTKGTTSNINGIETREEKYEVVHFFDMETKTIKWTQEFSFAEARYLELLEPFQYQSRESLLAVFSNYIVILDPGTGKILKKYELDDSICKVDIREKEITAYTVNGAMWGTLPTTKKDSEEIIMLKLFADDVMYVCRDQNKTFYTYQDEKKRIIRYEYEKFDSNYKEELSFAGSLFEDFQFQPFAENMMLAIDSWNSQIILYHMKNAQMFDFELLGNSFSTIVPLGISKDQRYLILKLYDWDEVQLQFCDLQTGDTFLREMPLTELTGEEAECGDILFRDDVFYSFVVHHIPDDENVKNELLVLKVGFEDFLQGKIGTDTVTVYARKDIGEKTLALKTLQWIPESEKAAFLLNEMYYIASNSEIEIMDPIAGDVTGYALDFIREDNSVSAGNLTILEKQKGYVLFYERMKQDGDYETLVNVLDTAGKEKCTFTLPEEDKVNTIVSDPEGNSCYLLLDDCRILQYNTQTGEQLMNLDLSDYLVVVSDVMFPDDATCLFYSGTKGVLVENFEGTYGITAVIPNCAGYDAKEDRILVNSYQYGEGSDMRQLGSFPRYHVEDLLQIAKESFVAGNEEEY